MKHFAVTLATALMASAISPAAVPRPDYLSEVWDMDRGLGSLGVTAIAQTPDGYLWFGTFKGLWRFNGAQFLVTDVNTPGFPGILIKGLHADRRGDLWAGTDGGVARLHEGKWQTFKAADGKPVRMATKFVEDASGGILIQSMNRLLAFDGKGFVEAPTPDGIRYLEPFRDSQGELWVTGSGYLGHFLNGTWTRVATPSDVGKLISGATSASDGGIWVIGHSSLRKFHNGIWNPPRPAPAGFLFTGLVRIVEDEDGNIWAGDYVRGLIQFGKDGHTQLFGRVQGLPNLAIRSLFEDHESNMWAGTDGGGVVRFRQRRVKVYDETAGLDVAVIDSVQEESPGNILLSTYGGGLIRFDESKRRMTRLGETGPLGRDGLVLTAVTDQKGRVWAGTFDHGLFRIDGRKVTQIPPAALGSVMIRALFPDSKGILRVGTSAGIASCTGESPTVCSEEPGSRVGEIHAIAEDPHGAIWAGGPAGLFYNNGSGFRNYLPPGFASYRRITALYTGRDGSLWIAAAGRGLDRLQRGNFTSYGPRQGLPASAIGGIVEDDKGSLWLSTESAGLISLPLDSLDARHNGPGSALSLRKDDGIYTNAFRMGYQPSAWKGHDGRLWFATLKGLAMVDPAHLHWNLAAAPVRIEEVRMNGKPLPVASGANGELKVPAGSRRLEFYYAALSFNEPDRIRFQYRLRNLDATWIDDTRRSASYGDIKPGTYIFEVRATNNDGIWNPVPASLKIRVEPFLWETWWFRLLALMCLTMITGGLVYGTQERKLSRKTAQLEKETALRKNLERLQAQVKTSEVRFTTAFHSSPLPTSITTLEGGFFIDANQRSLAMMGLSREQLAGRRRADVGLWGDPEQLALFERTIREAGQVRGFEANIRDSRGQSRRMILSADVIDMDGTACILLVADDITDRLQLQERLNQAQKLEGLGRLAGGLAHDFNNLLTVINGYSDMVLNTLQENDANRARVEQIRTAGDRAADLISQILAFSRKKPIQPRLLSLNSLVSETEGMLRRLLPSNIEMITRLESSADQILADPAQIQQVLMNLSANARDAMPAGGKIVILTENVAVAVPPGAVDTDGARGPWVLLSVSDTGSGMSDDTRSHLFEPFYTTKDIGQGTGLGLASVYGTVRQSGGSIFVDSAPGQGTTFRIYLPRAEKSPVAVPTPKPSGGSPRVATGTLLLVEDQPQLRQLAALSLRQSGYRVLEAVDGVAALAVAAEFEESIEMLITDVVMPRMTGPSLAERLKKQRPAIKVLFMSGYGESLVESSPRGDIPWLQKPMTMEALVASVQKTLGTEPESAVSAAV